MNLNGLKRILSGVLASIFVGQVLIYGDGSSQGIAHAETIQDIKNSINKSQAAEHTDFPFVVYKAWSVARRFGFTHYRFGE